jgi:hypothetical protein
VSASELHPNRVETNARVDGIFSPAEADDRNSPDADAVTDQPFVDNGLPIPETYHIDIIRAMVQDPYRVFVYWDIRQQRIDAITGRSCSDDPAAFQTTLKLIEVGAGSESFIEVDRQGSYWMSVTPGQEYEFEIGVRSPAGYEPLMRSNRVQSPNVAVSSLVADQAHYRLNQEEFAQVLEASGFPAAIASLQKSKDQREVQVTEHAQETILSGRSSGRLHVGGSSRLQ